ncbi:MAG: hypothetical protein Q4D21_05260, partial [Phascolarctobacterium sp.]|nr:hypothetical protein [Phascolarctobacterium sp.]
LLIILLTILSYPQVFHKLKNENYKLIFKIIDKLYHQELSFTSEVKKVFKNIDHLVITITDKKASTDFYKKLGFKILDAGNLLEFSSYV